MLTANAPLPALLRGWRCAFGIRSKSARPFRQKSNFDDCCVLDEFVVVNDEDGVRQLARCVVELFLPPHLTHIYGNLGRSREVCQGDSDYLPK